MPMPGKINSPVCLANGNGQDYTYSPSDSNQLKCVAVWQRPWQTPTGVMLQEVTGKGSAQVQMSGEFQVSFNDLYPSPFAVYRPANVLNQRVYYDSYAGKYIVQDAFKGSALDPQALYPGSATIGYISDVDVSARTVDITIDPRPATASYVVGLASTSTTWTLGKPVIIDPETNVMTAPTDDLTKFTGVVAGWLKPSTVPPIVDTPMVVVTRGPAWYHPNPDALYSKHDRSDLLSSPSTAIPIDITGAACSIGTDSDTAIIGTITLNEWYDPDSQTFPDYVLLDVQGGAA